MMTKVCRDFERIWVGKVHIYTKVHIFNDTFPIVTDCNCTYRGNEYPPGYTIYNTTDGHGNCITAVCGKNGTIDKRSYPCPVPTPTTHMPTATSPTTTFVFTTTKGRDRYLIWKKRDIQLYIVSFTILPMPELCVHSPM